MNQPITYQDALGGNLTDQIARYNELSHRQMMVRTRAELKARGEWAEDRERILGADKYPPLAGFDHLEMLALGEAIAFYYQHPSQVHRVVQAGATWEQIAAATGKTEQAARAAYRDWADGQHTYAGMGAAEYTDALKSAGDPGPHPAEAARRLGEIRALLARFDWEHDDRQRALEQIDRIADGGTR
jgi:hypothetical protein